MMNKNKVKKTFLKSAAFAVLLSGFCTVKMNAQVLFEDFENAAVGYTTSVAESSDNGGDYFGRVGGTGGLSIGGGFTPTGIPSGTGFFGAQDIDNAPSGGASNQTLTWTGLNISGLTSLMFSAYFAEADDGANQDWDDSDFVHVDYQIDGGGYQNLFWLENDGSAFNSAPFVDTDFDGTGNTVPASNEITDAFTQFSVAVAGTGNLLDLRITFDLTSGDEDIALDNVEVTGVVIPEPSTYALMAVGLVALVLVRRRFAKVSK